MIGDIFVFDNVIHLYDMSVENIRSERRDSWPSRQQSLEETARLRFPGEPPNDDPKFDWGRRWSVKEMHELVFDRSPTDMAMAQTVPMFDWFRGRASTRIVTPRAAACGATPASPSA